MRSWTCLSGETSNQKGLSEPCQGCGPYETRYHSAENSNDGSSHGELRKSGTKHPTNFNTFHERPRRCLRPMLQERNQRDAFEGAPLDCTRSGKFNATFSPRDGCFGSVGTNAGNHIMAFSWKRYRLESRRSVPQITLSPRPARLANPTSGENFVWGNAMCGALRFEVTLIGIVRRWSSTQPPCSLIQSDLI